MALTLEPPVHEATHWTVRAMAKAVGTAASSVVKIWHEHGLAPHRWRSFKLSNDKAFAEKLHDVVGLYVSPPAHAIVLSVDEKSQIQALDRTQPGLPLKRGRGATMTHDYKRNGTTGLARIKWSPRRDILSILQYSNQRAVGRSSQASVCTASLRNCALSCTVERMHFECNVKFLRTGLQFRSQRALRK